MVLLMWVFYKDKKREQKNLHQREKAKEKAHPPAPKNTDDFLVGGTYMETYKKQPFLLLDSGKGKSIFILVM